MTNEQIEQLKQKQLKRIEQLKRSAALPDDCVIDDPLAALMLSMSIWTLRRNNPVPAVQLSARKRGRRLGDIRKLTRGDLAPTAA